MPKHHIKIWVDADACPFVIREIIIRTGLRLQIEVVFVANQSIRVPKSELLRVITVRDGADIADHTIVEQLQANDVVITNDIPLAARVVEKNGIAIGSRGEVFDANSVQSRLASRNVMEQLRSAGVETDGPRPLSQKDVQNFSNSLDRTMTRVLKVKS
ncbi:MAG: YaiI/YqxD family protein [Planctomycetaceae bacterium]|nr:YaiI/YqxD family protein [Planctomycetaceae bacterium]